ncbi:MAG: hypothetical protein RL346_1764 [Verrucomicrobiota bacterium]|jgi:3'-5' exoribonuclease
MSDLSISALKAQAGDVPLIASVVGQLQSRAAKTTKDGKPFFDMVFVDSTGSINLKVWSSTPLYGEAGSMPLNKIVRLEGEWTQNTYGINGSGIILSSLQKEEIERFLAGDSVTLGKQQADYEQITGYCAGLKDPRLRCLCESFIEKMGERFRRTAAARKNHHARRGGLVEHVAQMMRSASAICGIYPELNRDLMIAGVLFHDCGKLWENSYPEEGFAQIHSKYGEMLGHISLGIELVNRLWNELSESPEFEAFSEFKPPSEDVKLHLLHLVASHHGQLEFGSPVLPKTPEAHALHYIDNLDAKMEMLRDAYAHGTEITPGIYERVFPLSSNLIKPLDSFEDGTIS